MNISLSTCSRGLGLYKVTLISKATKHAHKIIQESQQINKLQSSEADNFESIQSKDQEDGLKPQHCQVSLSPNQFILQSRRKSRAGLNQEKRKTR